MNTQTPEAIAKAYQERFGFQLRNRLAILAHRHPSVEAPSFISWEGAELTGADTTEKVRALLKVIPWV